MTVGGLSRIPHIPAFLTVMRAILFLLLFAGLAALGYFLWSEAERRRPAPPPAEVAPPPPAPTPLPTPPPEPEARLAPEGVLFVVRRFSETHDGGVRGFSEGAEVRLLRQEEGYYVVTDGVVEARRPRTWFTRDLALARDLREKRLTDRTQLQKRLEEERAAFERGEKDRVVRPSTAPEDSAAGRRPPAPAEAPSAALRPLRLGAWNLEFFGNRADPPRTDEDVQAVAEFIRAMDVQALAVCEVNGAKPLKDLCRRLGPGWKFVIGTSGQLGQEGQIAPGFVWDDGRLELVAAGELADLRTDGLFHRVPVMAAFRCRGGGPDFRMVAVHFKAGREEEDFTKRRGEAAGLRAYLGRLVADAGEDNDIVVVGDFNHDQKAAEADIWSDGSFASVLTGRGRSIIHFDRQIDHIVPLATFEEVDRRSFRIHNKEGLRDMDAWRQTYSDHFPVTVELSAQPDDDPEAKLSPQGSRLR